MKFWKKKDPNQLRTVWADSTDLMDFDRDQVEVEKWVGTSGAEPAKVEEAILNMTLADIEEFARTCTDTANTHRFRAKKAEELRAGVLARAAQMHMIATAPKDVEQVEQLVEVADSVVKPKPAKRKKAA